MSFSKDVKQELCWQLPQERCCQKAELAGLIALAGSRPSESEGGGIRLRTENKSVCLRAEALFGELFSLVPEKNSIKKRGTGSIYTLHLKDENYLPVIKSLGLWRDGHIKFCADPFIVAQSCCRRSFLRGAFLGGGSVTSPEKSYHLEIETHYRDLARDVLQLFLDEEMDAKTVMRKSNYVIYMKDSEEIADALTALGATTCALDLYSVKVEKEVKNQIQRRVNCETANLSKIAMASANQIYAINKLLSSHLKDELTPPMTELALLRLQNPEASLTELGQMLSEPISKSGVNRRLQKMIALAETI